MFPSAKILYHISCRCRKKIDREPVELDQTFRMIPSSFGNHGLRALLDFQRDRKKLGECNVHILRKKDMQSFRIA